MSRASERKAGLLTALSVALALTAIWRFWPAPEPATAAEPPAPQPIRYGSYLEPQHCAIQTGHPFVPTRISVPKVAKNAEVLALPRDARNVPQAPPLSTAGKSQFAWDAPTIKPGEAKGNVLINAHTWPDGTALGNRLLENLRVGGEIVLRGDDGEEICYTVTKREVIVASEGSWDYYEKDGPPQVALIVCSPPRLGPGNWLHRTIWYASPSGTPRAEAVRAS